MAVTVRGRAGGAALALVLGLTACTAEAAPDEVVVFAAASLSAPFSELGRAFEADHPGVVVRFSFDGSTTLVDQLDAGAKADVLATADRPTMDRATGAGLVDGTPQVFATNVLTLIVARGNPSAITGLDSSLEGKKLVTCAPGVPCGTATARLAGLNGVTLHPVSEETRVTDVRAKVESGQADAGIVYVTDARAGGGRLDAIALPRAEQAGNEYLVGRTTSGTHADLAAAFVDLVTGARGRQALRAAGFGAATP